MSNDAKLWAWRIALIVALVIDFSLLAQLAAAFGPNGHLVRRATVFFIAVFGSLPIGFKYHMAKQKRWGAPDFHAPDVETLNSYVKRQRQELSSKPAPKPHNK